MLCEMFFPDEQGIEESVQTISIELHHRRMCGVLAAVDHHQTKRPAVFL
jgi:hypothetical protein